MVQKTLELNNCSAILKNLNWTQFDLDTLKQLPKIDFIIGSDIFFSSKLFEGKSCSVIKYSILILRLIWQ